MIKKYFFQVLILALFLMVSAGCNNARKFDRQKWSYGDGIDYPLRNEIVDDLMKNHRLKGLNYRQLIDSLGSPQRRDSLQFTYQIQDDSYVFSRKKPAHTKNLIVYFSKDSVVVKTGIYEHTNKK